MKSALRFSSILALALVTGCSSESAAVSTHDSELALETLTCALDAWKLGRTDSLLQRDPAIRFVDDDCRAGWQLTDYEFESPGMPIEPYENVRVTLALRNPHGKTMERTVGYQVSVDPALSVLRSEP